MIDSSSASANHSRGWGDWLVVGRYWKNSCGSPATPVARSDSTSSVLPLRCEASTRYAVGEGMRESLTGGKWRCIFACGARHSTRHEQNYCGVRTWSSIPRSAASADRLGN